MGCGTVSGSEASAAASHEVPGFPKKTAGMERRSARYHLDYKMNTPMANLLVTILKFDPLTVG